MKHALVPSLTFCLLTLGLLLGHARAQGSSANSKGEGGQNPPRTLPRQEDVGSIGGILAAVYDVISGPAGQKRDWERMRSLFAPGARLIPTSPVRPPGSAPDAPLNGAEPYAPHVFDLEGFIERVGKNTQTQGFFERETARRVETYGHIAHAWSTYEARHKADDPKPFVRGINSIQLVHDGKRWWIVSIFWEAETAQTPVPEKYLKSAP
jgi:hypothetical protein